MLQVNDHQFATAFTFVRNSLVMITVEERIELLSGLGNFLERFDNNTSHTDTLAVAFEQLIRNIHEENPWFTEENVRFAVKEIAKWLQPAKLSEWIRRYPGAFSSSPKTVAVIMAGNIPLVGFHDFLSVFITGNRFLGKLSSKDNKLLPMVVEYLVSKQPKLKNELFLTEGQIKDFDAIIATGSNNTARYFDYYFSKYPNIIRKNRNSIAILTGEESAEDIQLLSYDIFRYFGLGCRNVSKIFIPEGYCFDDFFENLQEFSTIIHHNKYANNYHYNRSIYLMNQMQHYDNGFIMLKEDNAISSPIGVVYFKYYSHPVRVEEYVDVHKDNLQCVVGDYGGINNLIPFGESQKPRLDEYADNIDTIDFLTKLS